MAPKQKPKTSPNSTTSQPSISSEIIANNDDLLKQILLKLPLKSLIKFTSVCKHWLSFISGPEFSRRRNPIPGPVSGLLLPLSGCSIGSIPEYDFVDLNPNSSNPTNPPFRTLTFVNNPSGMGIGIVHACNGLFLCSANQAREPKEKYVFNPTTKKFTVLPLLPLRYRFVLGLNLAYDPSKSLYYKVVCVLLCESNDKPYQIEIYSSKTGTWRLSGDSFYANDHIEFDGGVFWNGSVHWISLWEPSLYFNVDQERLYEMSLPPVPEDWVVDKDFRYFGESSGHLHLIYNVYDRATFYFDVYEMERDYSGWFVKFRVDFSQFGNRFPETIPMQLNRVLDLDDFIFSVVFVVRGDVDDDDSYAVIRIPGQIISYNFKTKAFDKLCDIDVCSDVEIVDLLMEWFDAHQYIESLALV
ncbi:hypothetical protein UlMin_026399 [Ulmus minor]